MTDSRENASGSHPGVAAPLPQLGSLKSAKYTCKFQIHVLQRVAVAVRLEEDLCGKLGEGSLGASRSVAHHLDERYRPLYRGNATREFAT